MGHLYSCCKRNKVSTPSPSEVRRLLFCQVYEKYVRSTHLPSEPLWADSPIFELALRGFFRDRIEEAKYCEEALILIYTGAESERDYDTVCVSLESMLRRIYYPSVRHRLSVLLGELRLSTHEARREEKALSRSKGGLSSLKT